MNRNTVYQVKENGFYTDSAKRRMNRALYGKYYENDGSRLRVLAGELPEMMLFHKQDRGRIFFQISTEKGEKMLSDAAQIEMLYRDGMVSHTICDESFGEGTLCIKTIPDVEEHGAILQIMWTGKMPVRLTVFAGCVSGQKTERAMDIGYRCLDGAEDTLVYNSSDARNNIFEWHDEAVCLQRSDEKQDNYAAWMVCSKADARGLCSAEMVGNIIELASNPKDMPLAYHTVDCQQETPMWIWFGCEEKVDCEQIKNDLPRRFEQAVSHYRKVSRMMEVETPDKLLNSLTGAACIAAEGYWLDPVFAHGAWSWDIPIIGWRSMYGPAILGMKDRIWKEAALFTGLQLDENGMCANPEMEAYVKNSTRFQEGESYFNGQNQALVRSEQEQKKGGSPDEKWSWARQGKESIFVSEGMMPYMPTASRVPMYDMQEVFVDELLYTMEHTGDKEQMKKLFEPIKKHLEWESRCLERDGSGLYENFANYWASDAVYNSGAPGAIATAYNYRAHKCMAEIAEKLGEDSTVFLEKAEQISKAFQQTLWLEEQGQIAEWKDRLGEQFLHTSFSIPSVVHTAESGILSQEQIQRLLDAAECSLERVEVSGGSLFWNTNWVPYTWSVRDVDFADLFHFALTYFKNGQAEKGYEILCGAASQSACNMLSPGALMCVLEGKSVDFSDTVSMYIRCIYEGLFGIRKHLERGQTEIIPQLPKNWTQASVKTDTLDYAYQKSGNTETVSIHAKENAEIIFKLKMHRKQIVSVTVNGMKHPYTVEKSAGQSYVCMRISDTEKDICIQVISDGESIEMKQAWGVPEASLKDRVISTTLPQADAHMQVPIAMSEHWNDNVCDIFRHKYLSPRTDTCSLQVPYHLSPSDWCVVKTDAVEGMNDRYLRSRITDGFFTIEGGLAFYQPAEGNNIAYVSRWDNYPDDVTVKVGVKASRLYLLMACYSNQMQCDVINATVLIRYQDGTSEEHNLLHPVHIRSLEKGPDTERKRDAWCYRKQKVDRVLIGSKQADSGSEPQETDGVFAQVIGLPLSDREVAEVTVKARANEAVIGLMGITAVK